MGVTIAVGCGIGVRLDSGVEMAVDSGIAVGDIGTGEGVTIGASVDTGRTCGVGVLMTIGVDVGDMVPTMVTLGSWSASQAIVIRMTSIIPMKESRILVFNMEPTCEWNSATCHSRRFPKGVGSRLRTGDTLVRGIPTPKRPLLWP